MLTARKLVQSKFYDVEMSVRYRRGSASAWSHHAEALCWADPELVAGHASLEAIAEALLSVHEVLLRQLKWL